MERPLKTEFHIVKIKRNKKQTSFGNMNVFRNMLYMARRFKTATVLNLAGLAVAFASCFLCLTQVNYDLGYNIKNE